MLILTKNLCNVRILWKNVDIIGLECYNILNIYAPTHARIMRIRVRGTLYHRMVHWDLTRSPMPK